MKVGFIGVGNMGGPMCRNIIKRSNHQVTVFDLNAAAVKACTDLGGTAAKSIAEVTKGADLVMTSLPMPKDVEAVTLGDGGILANIAKGQTYIDLSTNAPSMVKKIGAAMTAKGIAMLDAPVSGGTTGAEAATIAIMVGGAPQDVERARPILGRMGNQIFHCGPLGAGQLAEALGLTTGAVTGVVDRLEGGAWVRRGRSETDRRAAARVRPVVRATSLSRSSGCSAPNARITASPRSSDCT